MFLKDWAAALNIPPEAISRCTSPQELRDIIEKVEAADPRSFRGLLELDNHLLGAVLMWVSQTPGPIISSSLCCTKLNTAVSELGMDQLKAKWLCLFDPVVLKSVTRSLHAGFEEISQCELHSPGKAHYAVPTVGQITLGSRSFAGFEAEILCAGNPSSSVGVAAQNIDFTENYSCIKNCSEWGGAWVYNSYKGAKFHHDKDITGRHYSNGLAYYDGDRIQCVIYTGSTTLLDSFPESSKDAPMTPMPKPAKVVMDAWIAFFKNGIPQGAMTIHCAHELKGVVVYGKGAHVRLHPVDSQIEDLIAQCCDKDYFTTADKVVPVVNSRNDGNDHSGDY